MQHMSKRINMKPVEIAAQNRKSLWPLIVVGAAAGMTWSWLDPVAADTAAVESLRLLQLFAQQGFDLVSENMRQLLANNSI